MKKILFFVFITMLFAVQLAFSVPANPEPIQRTQSDGTIVTVRIRGDERINWTESLDGYTLMNNNKLDLVFATRNADGDLQPTEILYKGQDLSKYSVAERNIIVRIEKKLRYSEEQVSLRKQIWEMTDGESSANRAGMQKATSPVITPVLGEKKILCILAGFSGKPMTYTQVNFNNLMNQVGYSTNGSTGSVKDFYRANSYGKMDITVTVVGPVNCANTAAYYGSDEDRWPNWAKEVATLADPLVNYAQFAVDGEVPNFHIIFAGFGDETKQDGQQIWSHKWGFGSNGAGGSYVRFDGVIVSTYSCSPEMESSWAPTTLTSVGVACHELCHAFGAPDYYDTDYSGSGGEYPGTGDWDLMASGSHNNSGKTPAQINMFQKILFGWVNPIELSSAKTITNMPNSVDSAMAYTVKVNNSTGEMYVLENRQKKGWDANVPGYGLLIYHVHQNALGGDCDNSAHPQECYVVAAGSGTAIPTSSVASYGDVDFSTAIFGGTKTTFDGTSTPRMFTWSGSSGVAYTTKPITNITRNTSPAQTVSFKFMGGTPDLYDISLNVTGTYTFDAENAGYSITFPKTIIVTNNGNKPTGTLTVALSGANASSFTLSSTSISSIGVGDQSTFTVVPKTGLNAGTHNATVTVSGGNGITASFNVSFTVTPVGVVPYFEGFESTSAEELPAGWTISNTGWKTTSFLIEGVVDENDNPNGSNPYTGSRYMVASWWYANADANPWTFSKGIQLNEGTKYKISFWYKAPGYSASDVDRFRVYIGQLATTLAMTGATTLLTHGPSQRTSEWTEFSTEFTAITSGIYYLGFQQYSATEAGLYIAIDDISIDEVITPVYSIELNQTGTYTFPAAIVGYGAQTAHSVTVSNTGNQATGALTVALSGANTSSFTLSSTSISSIGVDDNSTFTVVPKTGLNEGTHNATITVSGGNGITGSFNVSFTVNYAAPTITTTDLPEDTVHKFYSASLSAVSTTPVEWTIETGSGNLPDGLELSIEGVISGIPVMAGIFNFTVVAQNSGGSDTKQLSITIIPQETVNIDEIVLTSGLKAWVNKGIIYVNGLNIGQTWRIFSVSGALVQQGIASSSGMVETKLFAKGVYIIQSENRSVKVVNL